eukprot:m.76163 g.76163  ORF g.76163 m.76163 type:complete len:496 (+) comp20579_c0_seq5:184-1671(+)
MVLLLLLPCLCHALIQRHDIVQTLTPDKLSNIKRIDPNFETKIFSPSPPPGPPSPPSPSSNSNPTVYPTDFGADPTGQNDSSNSFSKALSQLFRLGSHHQLANNITDLGGATLDLGGGDFLLSQPLVIPQDYGNFRITRGTIRASATFPSSRYLIEVGSSTCTNPQKSCNQNVGLSDLMLDCQHYAAGGLFIGATMGANVGPQMFFLNFNEAGIQVIGGHEVMIHETWLGEYLYSDPRSHSPTSLNATAIRIIGNDHYVTNTIVFSSLIGVQVTGAANVLTGVHTWNLASVRGGIGLLFDSPEYTQNRVVACYLDYNAIVTIAPWHLTIIDSFFLCAGNIVIKAIEGKTVIQGLLISGNIFNNCGNDTVVLDQREANFTKVYDTVISDNLASSQYNLTSTRAHAALRQENATRWEFDFSNTLLFPEITRTEYSIQIEGSGFARHTVRPPQGRKVVVETDEPVTGTVFLFVDQSTPLHPVGVGTGGQKAVDFVRME